MDEDVKTYQTSDLYFAAYLAVAGAKYIGAKRIGKVVHFAFLPDEIPDLKDAWIKQEAEVQVVQYAFQLKAFKSACFSI